MHNNIARAGVSKIRSDHLLVFYFMPTPKEIQLRLLILANINQ